MGLTRMLARWRERRACLHMSRGCIHGDDVALFGGARAYCRSCSKILKGEPLPIMCTETTRPHARTPA